VRIGHFVLTRCLASLALIALASGCTSTRRGIQRLASSHLADTATSYNLAIEQTQDEMLLLNVIRAQDKYPLYLTDASKVTGTVKAEFNLGLKIPLVHAGSANANDYFGMPSVDYSSSPSMDVNLLNTKDFMTGFLTPIGTDLFAYYWDQGWSAEFLLYLLVLRVDAYDPSGKVIVHTWRNHPDSHDPTLHELRQFSTWVHDQLVNGRPLLCSSEGATIGPPVEENDLEPLKFLVPVAKENLSLSSADGDSTPAPKGTWQLRQAKQTFFLVPRKKGEAVGCPENAPPLETQSTASKADANARGAKLGVLSATGKYALTLRSPEGVLYYLGELARLENRASRRQAVLIHTRDYKPESDTAPLPTTPLFVALDRKDHSECPLIIWVRSLDGSDYLIPKGDTAVTSVSQTDALQLAATAGLCTTGETMHAFELLSQLIGLQKTAKDFQTTNTVKVVGQ
jgi:hypothetical protein